MLLGLLVVIGIVLAVFTGMYNGLVKGRIQVKEGFSGVDVQLKRRHNLIPNLLETVKGYMKHEKGVLEEVTSLRTKVMGATGVEEKAGLESGISRALKTIFAVSENYPDLKANTTFIELQKNLADIEDEIQLSRRYYNGAVRDYNIKVQSIPSCIVANMFNFTAEPFFEVESAEVRAVPKVQF
ncbi:MAG: hypothetical protein A2Y03_08820 [Omnitrophica WOR_2 bacterium GWF2_38_59]|nr:MAG: hypothetical protein A2Y03_08820 [Omnitrophica WOR_2 bacterium GWF2_38_59]OGX46723.1 MAG: hypothetical protein A2243_02450 [Omnitrophica WOR_2 bacterium RIFOXYA2_FULL_38_17]OGX53415.1 MAG: hypothetical protein A2267_09730 [Omnitrophica WOR_2 bacterium RIFOXYA12_FULL_38_10]OGX56594.1 MAG: hypothetical protein A2447_07125 [Omnitrophica WOR_2 bacterium RIFOXYC2_FULL_38_12]OGX59813.1 MAG: hypothetical protein A2306_05975 [Omnitrophica WOR_2 bacterium RIFOXYB2_FULL_38_16]HBG62126.1 hypothet